MKYGTVCTLNASNHMFSLHSFIKKPNDTQISLERNFTLISKLFKSDFSKITERSLENCRFSGKYGKMVKNCPKRLEKRNKRAQKYVSNTAKRIKVLSICPSTGLLKSIAEVVFLVLCTVCRALAISISSTS